MKNKLFKKLFTLTLTLLVAFAFAACTPEIHIHTGEESSEAIVSNNDTVASSDETATDNTSQPSVDTSVASSETSKVDIPERQESTASKVTSSKNTSSKVTSSKDTSSKVTSSKNTSSKVTSSSSNISASQAKEIALKDAGLKASQIYDYEIELDRDRGTLHYDVSFEYNGRDYDYEINAATGKIISVDKPNATSSQVTVSKSQAKTTALNHAGVKAADISRYEIELEKDDGIWKYEISFNKGYVEYEYTINAENGNILHHEKDIDD